MMHQKGLLIGWLLSSLTSAVPFGRMTHSALFGRQDDDFDEYDFSNIKKMAAIGDSYSAGIGAGNRLGKALDINNVANHYTDWWCSRYDHSYPYLLNKGLGDLNSRDGKFQFVSCSGATTKEVIDSQLDRIESGQDVILISSGGNDVGFADIINQCVYQFFSPTKILGELGGLAYDRAALKEWLAKAATRVGLDGVDVPLPDIDLLKYARTCEEELENSKKMIDGPDFAKGISDLISQAKKKLAPGGRIYYTSYAQFWSPDATDDDWCADPKHTWSVFLSKTTNVADWQSPVALTADHRTKMNEFVDAVNEKIFNAVLDSGEEVDFVKWDDYAGGIGGHFCRKEVQEPDTKRWNAAFYEWNINDPLGTSPFRRSVEDLDPGSFEADMNGFAGAAFEMGVAYKDDGNAGDGGIKKRSTFIPDGFGRIFHPTPIVHNIIADLIGWHMASKNARDHKQDLGPEIFYPGDQCLLPQPSGDEAATGGTCKDEGASGLLAKDFSSIYDEFCTKFNDPQTDRSINFDWKKEVDGLDDDTIDNGKTSIEVSWVPNKRSNECNSDCTNAFSALSETCGHAGAHDETSGSTTITVEGVQMAKNAEYDAGCGTYSYIVTPPKPKPSEPPAPAKPEKKCNTADGYKAFSRDAAFDLAKRVCEQLHDKKVVISQSGDSLPPTDLEYWRNGDDIAADGADLVINPNWALSGCQDQNSPTDVDFGAMSVDECTGTFMEVVDGCAPFDNPNGDKFWKYGGQNRDKCAFWTVTAQ